MTSLIRLSQLTSSSWITVHKMSPLYSKVWKTYPSIWKIVLVQSIEKVHKPVPQIFLCQIFLCSIHAFCPVSLLQRFIFPPAQLLLLCCTLSSYHINFLFLACMCHFLFLILDCNCSGCFTSTGFSRHVFC